MKIKDGFILKSIAGTNIVVPTGNNTVSFGSVITLNESGVFLWERLSNDITEEDLVTALLSEYSVDKTTAKRDVKEFIEKLSKAELLI